MLDTGGMRHRLTRDIFIPDPSEEGLGQLEAEFKLIATAREAQKKTRNAVRLGRLTKEPAHSLTERAVGQGIIDAEEGMQIKIATKALDAVIQVDSFSAASYSALKG
jgi:acyl-CoA dehydrogenase